MTLPSSGAISALQINAELNKADAAPISFGDEAVRSLAKRPSGAISMDDLHGKSSVFRFYYDLELSRLYNEKQKVHFNQLKRFITPIDTQKFLNKGKVSSIRVGRPVILSGSAPTNPFWKGRVPHMENIFITLPDAITGVHVFSLITLKSDGFKDVAGTSTNTCKETFPADKKALLKIEGALDKGVRYVKIIHNGKLIKSWRRESPNKYTSRNNAVYKPYLSGIVNFDMPTLPDGARIRIEIEMD